MFTPLDSLVRLQRVQATCKSLGVDGILFVCGVDGRDNLGSTHAINYLLGGLSGYDLLERHRPAGRWAEDIVLVVRPTSCEIHVAADAHAAVLPLVAHWGDVTVHCLEPPGGRATTDRDRDRPVPPPQPDDGLPDDRLFPADEDEDEDEDVLQDFKLTSLVSMLTGMRSVAVALTPRRGAGVDAAAASSVDGDVMETETWPLLQAYGLEGVGRAGFFTMNTRVRDAWRALHVHCYTALDRPAVAWELTGNLPALLQHWTAATSVLDDRTAAQRAALTARHVAEPLTEFHQYGSMRHAQVHGTVPFKPRDLPRVSFGTRTGLAEAGCGEDTDAVAGDSLHVTIEAAHPKSPGMRAARTYFLASAADAAAAANGFAAVRKDFHGSPSSVAEETSTTRASRARENDVRLLVGTYAAIVSAGRAAMGAAAEAWEKGFGPSGWEASRVPTLAATEAFVEAADRLGLPAAQGADRAADLKVRLWTSTVANAPAADPPAAGAGRTGHVAATGAATALAVCHVSLSGIVGAHGAALGGVVYADTFIPVPSGGGGKGKPLIATSAVPLFKAWPAEGAEADACEGTRDIMRRLLRDALQKVKRKGRKGAPPAPQDDDASLSRDDPDVYVDLDELDDAVDLVDLDDTDDTDTDDDEEAAADSQRYTLNDGLVLGPAVLVPKPEPVLAFPRVMAPSFPVGSSDEEDDAMTAVLSGGEGVAGEWTVYENGVALNPAHATALPLVFGSNVSKVEVHDGLAHDPTEGVVVFHLKEGAAAAGFLPPTHLFETDGRRMPRALCVSLAPMGLKARRHFLREVVPRWRAAGAIDVLGSLPPLTATTRAQRWAIDRASVERNSAPGGEPGKTKTFPTHAPDERVVAAACASGGVAAPESAPESAPAAVYDVDTAPTPSDAVPVTLLAGTPDGCQDAVVRALTDLASSAATWIVAEVPLREGGGICVSRGVLERVVHDALPRVRTARAKASGGMLPQPHVLFVARTYQPAAAVGLAVRSALAAVSQLSQLSGDGVAFRLGAVTACVAADAFFAEGGSKRPALGALAQLLPFAANNVVILPSATPSPSHTTSAPTLDLATEAAAWVRALAAAATTKHLGRRCAGVNVIVSGRALRSAPLAVAEGHNLLPVLPASGKTLNPKPYTVSPWEVHLLAATVAAPARARVTARHAAAVGSIDLGSLTTALRRAFGVGRLPPPPPPSTLSSMRPDDRLAYESSRFTERDPDADGAGAVLSHVRVRATRHRVDPGEEEEEEEVVADITYNDGSAAPFEAEAALAKRSADHDARDPEVVDAVEVLVAGRNVAERFDLSGLLERCAFTGPKTKPLKTTLTGEEKAKIAEKCKAGDLPEGWYYNGSVYVEYDGTTSRDHPAYKEACEAFLAEENHFVAEHNAWCAEEKSRIAGVRVVRDEKVPVG